MTPEKTSDRITEMFLGDRPPDGNAQAGHWDAISAEVLAQVESAISQAIKTAEKERDEARSKLAGTLTVLRVIRESPHSDFVGEWAGAAVEEAVAARSRSTREACVTPEPKDSGGEW